MKNGLIILITFLYISYGKNIECMLQQSASTRINNQNKIITSTSNNDSIYVHIKNIGENIAILDYTHKLQILKKDENAIYYTQNIIQGIAIWAYFYKTNTITYCKMREFPLGNLPDSYLMIGKCK